MKKPELVIKTDEISCYLAMRVRCCRVYRQRTRGESQKKGGVNSGIFDANQRFQR